MEKKLKELIDGLNKDLQDEIAAVCRYIQQAAVATGWLGHEGREFFKEEATHEVGHALFLADKIASLGGKPSVKPSPYKELTDAKAMLEYDLEMEREAVRHYAERCKQAEACDEIGLKVRLEDIIADETEHAENIMRLLGKTGQPS